MDQDSNLSTKIEEKIEDEGDEKVEEEPAEPKDKLSQRENKLFDLSNLKSGEPNKLGQGGMDSLEKIAISPGNGPSPSQAPASDFSTDQFNSPFPAQPPMFSQNSAPVNPPQTTAEFPAMFNNAPSSNFGEFDTSAFSNQAQPATSENKEKEDWFNF